MRIMAFIIHKKGSNFNKEKYLTLGEPETRIHSEVIDNLLLAKLTLTFILRTRNLSLGSRYLGQWWTTQSNGGYTNLRNYLPVSETVSMHLLIPLSENMHRISSYYTLLTLAITVWTTVRTFTELGTIKSVSTAS